MHETGSVVRVLILDIADKDFVLCVPTFEVATSKFQQLCGRLFLEYHDVLLCYIAKGFILASMTISVLILSSLTVPWTYMMW
jgi:hypothetical protein